MVQTSMLITLNSIEIQEHCKLAKGFNSGSANYSIKKGEREKEKEKQREK